MPEGRRGRILALVITLAAALLLWLGGIAPLLAWYQARAAELAQKQALAARMMALAQSLPALRATAAAAAQADGAPALLAGASDAIAGANLQSAMQDLAAQVGTSLDSAAMQPAQQDGALRRISVQVSVTASWPALVALLRAVGSAAPRMIVDGISLSSADPPGSAAGEMVQASFTVSAYRAGAAS